MPSSYSIITLKGKTLHRNEIGTKLIDNAPIKFPSSWESAITVSPTLYPEGIALLHTGRSNIIAIDFDDDLFEHALALNDTLSPEHQCKYIARSINKPGGHMLYRNDVGYDDSSVLLEYIDKPNGKKFAKLDTLYGETLCFLATTANKTKELITPPLEAEQELTPIPLAMQMLIIAHYAKAEQYKNQSLQTTLSSSNVQGSRLGELAELALTHHDSMLKLLNVITPRQWKAILASNSESNLPANHPDRLPMTESAHMYMVSLSAVLMLDPSIDGELHAKLIKAINSLFSSPLDAQRLNTILKRDIAKSNYDKDWKSKSFIVMSRNNEPLEVFKYTAKGSNKFIVYNHLNYSLLYYDAHGPVLDYLLSVSSTGRVDKNKLIATAKHVTIIDRPDEPFGYAPAQGEKKPADTFNVYKWTQEQEIFYNPHIHEKDYKHPTVTLKALESAIGSEQLYKRFLPFMRRKFMTREHSPLFFVFYGVPHSFKSAVVNGVFSRLAYKRVTQPSLEVLTDKYNDFLVNKDFIVLDEIQHYMQAEKAKLIKALKEYTGNAYLLGIRAMHTTQSSDVYPQEATFVLTTNEATQLTTEAGDRRMVVFKSLTRVADALQMSNTAIQTAIEAETKDFSYYLSVHTESLYGDVYKENYDWQDEAYKLFQENALSVEDKLAKLVDSEDWDEFFNMLLEIGITYEMSAKSLYTSPRKTGYILRIANTKDYAAAVPGLFDKANIDYKKLAKKLQNIKHVTNSINEYVPGTSTLTGSRKTEVNIVKPLNKDLIKYIVDTGVKPLDGDCEL